MDSLQHHHVNGSNGSNGYQRPSGAFYRSAIKQTVQRLAPDLDEDETRALTEEEQAQLEAEREQRRRDVATAATLGRARLLDKLHARVNSLTGCTPAPSADADDAADDAAATLPPDYAIPEDSE